MNQKKVEGTENWFDLDSAKPFVATLVTFYETRLGNFVKTADAAVTFQMSSQLEAFKTLTGDLAKDIDNKLWDLDDDPGSGEKYDSAKEI